MPTEDSVDASLRPIAPHIRQTNCPPQQDRVNETEHTDARQGDTVASMSGMQDSREMNYREDDCVSHISTIRKMRHAEYFRQGRSASARRFSNTPLRLQIANALSAFVEHLVMTKLGIAVLDQKHCRLMSISRTAFTPRELRQPNVRCRP
jgi:hypothetical protein